MRIYSYEKAALLKLVDYIVLGNEVHGEKFAGDLLNDRSLKEAARMSDVNDFCAWYGAVI